MGAGKRLLTGESLFMTVFQNRTGQKRKVAFGAPYPGKIVAIHLAEIGGELIAQKDSFLARGEGRQRSASPSRDRLGVGLFGGEGFIMQRLQGDGWAFVHAGGTLHERTLAAGEIVRVDTGCIVAFQPTVQLRHPVRRQDQVGALRRRRAVLRDADRPGPGLAPVAAAQPARQPDHRGGPARRRAAAAKKARSSAGSAACSTATTAEEVPKPGQLTAEAAG